MAQYVQGNRHLDSGDALCTRASSAFSPYTGEGVRPNVPRITNDTVYYNIWNPRITYRFSGEVELTYANFLTRMATWETSYLPKGWVKILLGTSFQGRNVYGYRLGDITKPHAVFDGVVHGNEHDGINGTVKAMEILTDDPEFAEFRSEYSIFWVPVLNPDGYFLNTRNLANVGPNGKTVNLNRNWDWWWSTYTETAFESKGGAPESEVEAQNFLNYWRFGNGGAPTTWAFLMDMHANRSPGARYQSRDRAWARISGAAAFPRIPGSSLELDLHMQIRKVWKNIETLRLRENSAYPELFTRAYHSRFNPHMHSYFSSQGVFSMITEDIKVDAAAPGTETYDTACNFRLDYILSAAACLTPSYWEKTEGILLEPGATNALTNPGLDRWSSLGEYRPQWWSLSRAENKRLFWREGTDESGERFYSSGEAVSLTARVALALDSPAEYVRMAATGPETSVALSPVDRKIYLLDLAHTSGTALTLARLEVYGPALGIGDALNTADIIGGGTAAPSTGATANVHRINTTSGAEVLVGNLNTARMFCAFADNHLDASPWKTWVFGGYDAAGARLTSIEEWNATTNTATSMVAVLPTALADACAEYVPETNTIYIFGGTTGAGMVDTIYEYDVSADTLVLHATSMLVGLKRATASIDPVDSKIFIIGGELASGDMSPKIYSFNYSTGDFVEEKIDTVTADLEDNENGDSWPWNIAMGRHGAVSLEQEGSSHTQIIFGGGRLTDGAGALTGVFRVLDPTDDTISSAEDLNFGYLRFGSGLFDTKIQTAYADDFSTGLGGWTDLSAAWEDGGGFAIGRGGRSGWLVCNTPVTYNNERVRGNISVSGSGAHPNFEIVSRGIIVGAVPTDGYIARYTNGGVNQVWYLLRRVGSVDTVLGTLDVTALATRQIVNAYRLVEFRCEDQDPVYLRLTYNGYRLFDYYDVDLARIKVKGESGFFGGSI